MRIYVGNLAYQVTAEDLKAVFIAYHKVESAFIITDRTSGKSKGFGYVDISPDSEAKAAIEELTGKILHDRPLILKIALPPGKKEEGAPQPPKKLGNRSRFQKSAAAGPSNGKSPGGKPAYGRDNQDGKRPAWKKSSRPKNTKPTTPKPRH